MGKVSDYRLAALEVMAEAGTFTPRNYERLTALCYLMCEPFGGAFTEDDVSELIDSGDLRRMDLDALYGLWDTRPSCEQIERYAALADWHEGEVI